MDLIIASVLVLIAAETSYLTITNVRRREKVGQAPIFIDTSVLIDGRILAIAESGFLTRPLQIPRSVVGELQFLADNADTEKRTRARHGLDVIRQLQDITAVKTAIFPDGTRAEDGVDNRLLELAKKHKGAVCTIDYNLNKVALVEGIEVLNVNELAKTLRMSYLPGERLRIELTQKGNDAHQAVGHLPDGTMVVVEHAYKQIGTIAEVEFIRGLQTAAGKMMFAKLTQPDVKDTKAQKASIAGQKLLDKKVSKPHKATRGVVAPKVKTAVALKPAASKPVKATPKPRPQQRRSRRRTPEDSLVELANK